MAFIWLRMEPPTVAIIEQSWVGPGHLLQDGDEGANLRLGKS